MTTQSTITITSRTPRPGVKSAITMTLPTQAAVELALRLLTGHDTDVTILNPPGTVTIHAGEVLDIRLAPART